MYKHWFHWLVRRKVWSSPWGPGARGALGVFRPAACGAKRCPLALQWRARGRWRPEMVVGKLRWQGLHMGGLWGLVGTPNWNGLWKKNIKYVWFGNSPLIETFMWVVSENRKLELPLSLSIYIYIYTYYSHCLIGNSGIDGKPPFLFLKMRKGLQQLQLSGSLML